MNPARRSDVAEAGRCSRKKDQSRKRDWQKRRHHKTTKKLINHTGKSGHCYDASDALTADSLAIQTSSDVSLCKPQ
jgi:hypothetical protein